MSEFLGYDLKFKKSGIEQLRDTLNFILNMVPQDLPFNPGYGVEIPSDKLESDFCESYKSNLETEIRILNLNVTIESVLIANNKLEVVIKYPNNEMDTWRLSL